MPERTKQNLANFTKIGTIHWKNVFITICCLFIWMGGWSIMIWHGDQLLQEANYIDENAAKEDCLIIGVVDEQECSYDCDCTTRANGAKDCKLCWGSSM